MTIKLNLASGVLLSTLTLSIAQTSVAATQAPDVFVKQVADNLVNALTTQRAAYKKDPKVLQGIVNTYIEPYVDFDGFARGVMGKYGQIATPAQKAAFQQTFKTALLRTYTNSLAAYDNQSYSIRPYVAGNNTAKAVVTMDFKTDQGKTIPVTYQLVQLNNNWKVRNIQLNGIDIGLTFNKQYADTVQKYKGNIDQATANFIPANNTGK